MWRTFIFAALALAPTGYAGEEPPQLDGRSLVLAQRNVERDVAVTPGAEVQQEQRIRRPYADVEVQQIQDETEVNQVQDGTEVNQIGEQTEVDQVPNREAVGEIPEVEEVAQIGEPTEDAPTKDDNVEDKFVILDEDEELDVIGGKLYEDDSIYGDTPDEIVEDDEIIRNQRGDIAVYDDETDKYIIKRNPDP